ncbi:hypothetical protein ACH4U5_09285 [Streptomyces sp. NPDC020858]|uniref:hypothetical protein n=1 Tax=Streptomyces sp. NPDC020858 TaxID=3365097 RepID=UPI00379459FC
MESVGAAASAGAGCPGAAVMGVGVERERAAAGETHSPDACPRRPSASHITDVELDELFRERDGYLRLAALLLIRGSPR